MIAHFRSGLGKMGIVILMFFFIFKIFYSDICMFTATKRRIHKSREKKTMSLHDILPFTFALVVLSKTIKTPLG